MTTERVRYKAPNGGPYYNSNTIRLVKADYDALCRVAADWELSLSESIRWAIREADARRGKRS